MKMMPLLRGRSPISQALSLAYGHQDFIRRNTGTTNDPHTDHFIQNEEGVLSNNRHFIADTMQEYQPNGDGTTEGQSLHVIGYCHMYLATHDTRWLDAAVHAWEAYIKYFYKLQPIPDTPQRYICNWLVNAKEPSLANYPIHPVEPTHGGYKCVPLRFVNGEAQIPHGAPFWGEYLDTFKFAHRGHMTWGAINASVQRIQEDVDGNIDWDDILANYVITDPAEPWETLAWIDWPRYLNSTGYTPIWSGAKGETWGVESIVAWTGNRITDDEITEEGLPESDKGKVVLLDKTLNGVYLVNYAVRLPVDKGGYLFARNEPWHNRPVNTPFLGSVNQLGNAADAEVWFIDACYLLWRITGETRYKKALDCVFWTAHEYTYIDLTDRFFRRSTLAETPFTDAISYDFTYPDTVPITYGRDAQGNITIYAPLAAQHFLEQQAVWFRINQQSKLRATFGGVATDGSRVACRVMLDINPVKAESQTQNWYMLTLPESSSMEAVQYDIPVGSLAKMTNDVTGEDYLIADARAISDYGGCVWDTAFEQDVYDGRQATIIKSTFPNDDAGLIVGFWLTNSGLVKPLSIVYRADADFNFRFEDADKWRWWWMLPATDGKWVKVDIDPTNAHLSGYQPDHDDTDPEPSAPNYDTVDQITILQDGNVANAHFDYYCMNDVPPLFAEEDGWTLTYRMMVQGKAEFNAVVGDCTIKDFRLDSLAYCPGTIPFSNIYSEGTEQLGAWHGMPYPGYQYPFMYTIHKTDRYDLWFQNQIEFMYQSQVAYQEQIGELGPGCAAYIWNRWDNYKYGDPDTWTTFHWGTDHPWAGYQPRAFNAAARAWYELVVRGKPVPTKLQTYVERWITWLVSFVNRFDGHTPNEFPVKPGKPVWVEDDFTAHMCALWLAGSCYAAMAGCQVDGLNQVIDSAVKELSEGFTVTEVPGKAINGAWSPAARVSNDNGMAFGFYTGECLRGLGTYLMYKKHGAGYDMYRGTAIPDHAEAVLDVVYVMPE